MDSIEFMGLTGLTSYQPTDEDYELFPISSIYDNIACETERQLEDALACRTLEEIRLFVKHVTYQDNPRIQRWFFKDIPFLEFEFIHATVTENPRWEWRRLV